MAEKIIEIIKDDKVLARYIPNSCLVEGLGFYSKDDEFIQIGSWKYKPGKKLFAHNHFVKERRANRTQEAVVILKGSLKVSIYDENDNFMDYIHAKTGDVVVLLNGGHGYEIVEEDIVTIEIKNGPYLGAENDRRRL